jgi:type I restriction enzyme S subunit
MATGPGIIIGRKGTLGSVHYSEGDYWPHDTTLWSKSLNGNNPRFVYYALKCLGLERFNVGGANPTLNRNHIHGLPILIPDRPVQDKIASCLSAYDYLIENNRKRIALLEEAARLVYREWFVYLRFPRHEHVNSVDGLPEGWATVSASDVMNVLSGGTPKTSTASFWGGEIPFFTPKDATATPFVLETEKNITEEGLRSCNSQLYPPETLFITARGTVGKLNLGLVPMAMNQSCYALRSKSYVGQRYLYLALKAAIQHIQATATGAVFDAIIVATFDRIPFLLPPQRITDEFTLHVDPMFDQIANLIRQNQGLADARDLLLPRLINGEIAV